MTGNRPPGSQVTYRCYLTWCFLELNNSQRGVSLPKFYIVDMLSLRIFPRSIAVLCLPTLRISQDHHHLPPWIRVSWPVPASTCCHRFLGRPRSLLLLGLQLRTCFGKSGVVHSFKMVDPVFFFFIWISRLVFQRSLVLFLWLHFLFCLVLYSDISANEDNSFRNHIR